MLSRLIRLVSRLWQLARSHWVILLMMSRNRHGHLHQYLH
jgi:hypothetical protein